MFRRIFPIWKLYCWKLHLSGLGTQDQICLDFRERKRFLRWVCGNRGQFKSAYFRFLRWPAAALLTGLFSFCAFGEGGKAEKGERILDLGEIEVTGEIRRPNINLIYSKKYFDEAITVVAKQELKNLERELLRPEADKSKKPEKKKK